MPKVVDEFDAKCKDCYDKYIRCTQGTDIFVCVSHLRSCLQDCDAYARRVAGVDNE